MKDEHVDAGLQGQPNQKHVEIFFWKKRVRREGKIAYEGQGTGAGVRATRCSWHRCLLCSNRAKSSLERAVLALERRKRAEKRRGPHWE
jgi:hypothetical protein